MLVVSKLNGPNTKKSKQRFMNTNQILTSGYPGKQLIYVRDNKIRVYFKDKNMLSNIMYVFLLN